MRISAWSNKVNCRVSILSFVYTSSGTYAIFIHNGIFKQDHIETFGCVEYA